MKPTSWAALRGFHVITVSNSFETPHSTYGPFVVDRYGMAWIVEGGGTTRLDEHAVETRPGSVVLMRPGMALRHDWGKKRSFQCFIVFDFQSLGRGWPDTTRWPLERQLGPDEFVFTLWRFILAAEHSERALPVVAPGAELILRMLLTGTTDEIATTAPGLSDQVERALDQIVAMIAREPRARLRLSELAQRVHVTPQHLCRLFQHDLEASPMECAELLRIEQAASEIERSELNMSEIADHFGYSSPFHFSRNFSRAYGIPPSQYREQFRAGFATRPGGLVYRHHRLRRYLYEREPGKVMRSR